MQAIQTNAAKLTLHRKIIRFSHKLVKLKDSSRLKHSFRNLEAKWQKYWEENRSNQVDLHNAPRPFYNLMMFPYPSAEGLHVGNVFAFVGSDIYGRTKRLQGYNVFEPIGFDAFGIHSENYALNVKQHPSELIPKNIKNFTRQLKQVGLMLDWSHTVDTTNPNYYKWTQWIFLQLYKAGLAYRKTAPVNWCPACKTVLADEQVINGECERHPGVAVLKKELPQWFFKITAYAQKLLDNLSWIDWSEITKQSQFRWIGRSEGSEIDFPIDGSREKIKVFTTRPDTIFGATYMVLAPEHPLVGTVTSPALKKAVDDYVQSAKRKDFVQRTDITREKTGVFTGGNAVNPATNKKIPIWVADYVLMEYGTGAIMAVPAHDQRDFEFAKKFNLNIVEVISPDCAEGHVKEAAFVGEGSLINSGQFNGTGSAEARSKVTAWLAEKGLGRASINYRLHDWCISRQRYWGPPIPMIHCGKCGTVPVPEKDLPVLLPKVENYAPDDSGKSPLARVENFVKVSCPECGGPATRDTDVSDNFLDSAWYFLRYPSTDFDDVPMDPTLTKKWLPVDMYIGGNEHAVLHLMYTRFLCMALHDIGHLHFEEPFKRFRAHGLIIKDGAKMSKSKGNIVNPDQYIDKYGADTFRMYLMFLGPYQEGGDFRDSGIVGIERFLEKVFSLLDAPLLDWPLPEGELLTAMHETIKQVSEDIEALKYNTAIARLMEYVNLIKSHFTGPPTAGKEASKHKVLVENLALLLAPFAPHAAEELWARLGNRSSIFAARWPSYDVAKIKRDQVTVVLQVNGKVRSTVSLPVDSDDETLRAAAMADKNIQRHLDTKQVVKVIVVKNKLVNVVVR
jgi:leucyl-tRNA synthetase